MFCDLDCTPREKITSDDAKVGKELASFGIRQDEVEQSTEVLDGFRHEKKCKPGY